MGGRSVGAGVGGQGGMGGTMPRRGGWAGGARRRGSDGWLQVEGGSADRTIGVGAAAGAETCVAGSAVYGADDVEAAVTRLRGLAGAGSLEA